MKEEGERKIRIRKYRGRWKRSKGPRSKRGGLPSCFPLLFVPGHHIPLVGERAGPSLPSPPHIYGIPIRLFSFLEKGRFLRQITPPCPPFRSTLQAGGYISGRPRRGGRGIFEALPPFWAGRERRQSGQWAEKKRRGENGFGFSATSLALPLPYFFSPLLPTC